MNVHMADAIEMPDDGHTRFLLHASHQSLATARHDDVDDTACCQQSTHHGAVARGNQLYCRHRQACCDQPLRQTRMQGYRRIQAFTASTQDGHIAALQAQGTGIHRHIGAAFVNDGDDAQWHTNPLEMQPIGPGPFAGDGADRVRQGRHLLQTLRNTLETLRVQRQAVQHGG